MKRIIELQEDVQIGDVILEKGDKIEVLEEAVSYATEAEATEALKKVDFTPILKKAGISAKITVKEVRQPRGEAVYVIASSDNLIKDAGIFKSALVDVFFRTFTSEVFYGDDGDLIWWTSWSLSYSLKDSGSNSMTVIDAAMYNFNTNKWTFR